MCTYHLLTSPCGHHKLLAGSSCALIYAQLQRINDPAELDFIPFEVPPECMPNRRNVRRAYTHLYCSMECANNGVWGERFGEREARYGPGSERIGVGWRSSGLG